MFDRVVAAPARQCRWIPTPRGRVRHVATGLWAGRMTDNRVRRQRPLMAGTVSSMRSPAAVLRCNAALLSGSCRAALRTGSRGQKEIMQSSALIGALDRLLPVGVDHRPLERRERGAGRVAGRLGTPADAGVNRLPVEPAPERQAARLCRLDGGSVRAVRSRRSTVMEHKRLRQLLRESMKARPPAECQQALTVLTRATARTGHLIDNCLRQECPSGVAARPRKVGPSRATSSVKPLT